MSVALDQPLRLGETIIAALSERTAGGVRIGPALAGHGSKRPVAILVHRDGLTTAFDVDGTAIPSADFDLRYPDHRAAFEALISGKHGTGEAG